MAVYYSERIDDTMKERDGKKVRSFMAHNVRKVAYNYSGSILVIECPEPEGVAEDQ